MGYVAHDAVIVTASGYGRKEPWWPDVDAFRDSLPEQWRHLLVGPVVSVTNGYLTWAFLSDGSKSGWDTDEQGDGFRQRFVELFSFAYEDGSSPFDVVILRYGADLRYDFEEPRASYATPVEKAGSAS